MIEVALQVLERVRGPLTEERLIMEQQALTFLQWARSQQLSRGLWSPSNDVRLDNFIARQNERTACP